MNKRKTYLMKKDNFSKNIERFLTGDHDVVTFHHDTSDGFLNLTAYYILPGIYLVLNDIHTQMVPSNRNTMPQDILLINYCRQGRCEFQINNDNYSYIDTRLMNISSQMVQDYFYYPSSYYEGYEIYVMADMFQDETKKVLNLFQINPEDLIRLYRSGAVFYTPDPVLRLWNHITEHCAFNNIGQLRLDTLQLLKYFQDHKPEDASNALYLSKVQVILAKKVQNLLTQDLSQHLSMRSVSEILGVSESSLKRYFYSVFGVNVSTYMNEVRMKKATELLVSSEMSISDIAKTCGYVNQGRFASVFRSYYGMKPLDYRRNSRFS